MMMNIWKYWVNKKYSYGVSKKIRECKNAGGGEWIEWLVI